AGYMDAMLHTASGRRCRQWSPHKKKWEVMDIYQAFVASDIPRLEGYSLVRQVKSGSTQTYAVGNDKEQTVLTWSQNEARYVKTGFSLPPGAILSNLQQDSGLRLIDLDGDGYCDVVFYYEK